MYTKFTATRGEEKICGEDWFFLFLCIFSSTDATSRITALCAVDLIMYSVSFL